MQDVFPTISDNGVAGIVASLSACNDVHRFSKVIDDLALAFVSPLETANNSVHKKRGKKKEKRSYKALLFASLDQFCEFLEEIGGVVWSGCRLRVVLYGKCRVGFVTESLHGFVV